MRRSIRLIAGAGIRWKLRRRFQRTLQRAQSCQAVQRATLSRLLELNRDTDFSRDHLLGVKSSDQFRQQLSITDYSFIAPYVERVKAGKQSALLGPRNKLLMFALTSGTTSETKYIPVTTPFLNDYRRGWQLWALRAFDAHPLLHQLKIFQVTSNFDKHRTAANVPCGNISGLVQHIQPPLIKLKFTVPEIVQRLKDAETKYYVALLKGMADPDIGLLTTANPSTLIQLARLLAECAEMLVKDLRDGTCVAKFPSDLEQHFRFRPHRNRAKHLDQLLQKNGTLQPLDIWPDLSLLAIWTGGSASAYLPQLRTLYGDIPVRDHGLSASEGRMTIPLEDESSSGLLDIESHYFEFIPVDEIDSASPLTLEAHELDVGSEYFILLTTASGLYRYDIRDVVECTGFLGTTPLLKFLHKGAHIASLTGEKITETQVVQAVSNVAHRLSLLVSEFIVAPTWGDPPHYLLLVPDEVATCIPNHPQFANGVDEELKSLNCEYAEKRNTQRLEPIELKVVQNCRWDKLRAERQSGIGGSLEQYKHPFLIPHLEFANSFLHT